MFCRVLQQGIIESPVYVIAVAGEKEYINRSQSNCIVRKWF